MMKRYAKEREQEIVDSAIQSDDKGSRMEMMTLRKLINGEVIEVGEMYLPWKMPVNKRRSYIVRELERRTYFEQLGRKPVERDAVLIPECFWRVRWDEPEYIEENLPFLPIGTMELRRVELIRYPPSGEYRAEVDLQFMRVEITESRSDVEKKL